MLVVRNPGATFVRGSPEATGLELMIRATAQYAKRQRTWFRTQTDVRWLEPGESL